MQTTIYHLQILARLIRHHILTMTHAAGSGHPTTCFSAVDLMTVLFFKYFHADLDHFDSPLNDRLIFSKGHASALLYSLYAAAGKISKEELLGYRTIESNLEGHPTFRFPFTEAATGSLGQGLSIGAGEAWVLHFAVGSLLNATNYSKKSDNAPSVVIPAKAGIQKPQSLSTIESRSLDPDVRRDDGDSITSSSVGNDVPRVFVLLGDGELAEGSVWEAAAFASHYKLNNLIAIADINRFGQSEETMHGHDVDAYVRKFEAFGWETAVIDGHEYGEIDKAFETSVVRRQTSDKPIIMLAKTIKGKGISVWEGKNGWHNKMLSPEEFEKGKKELGEVNWELKGEVSKRKASSVKGEEKNSSLHSIPVIPMKIGIQSSSHSGFHHGSFNNQKSVVLDPGVRRDDNRGRDDNNIRQINYIKGELVATKEAFGDAVEVWGSKLPGLMVLDGDVANSLHTDKFKKAFPDRFLQCFIAEQNMVGVATGLSRRGLLPVVTTFSAFMTRAHDQIRMLPLSDVTVYFSGSYSGVSMGKDGPSQMGLEDLALFRNIHGSTVLYPSDAVSAVKLTELILSQKGVVYIRTTREPAPVIYSEDEDFKIGGSKIFYSSNEVRSNQHVIPAKAGIQNPQSLGTSEARSLDPDFRRDDSMYSSRLADARSNNKLITIIAAGITVFEALKAQKELEKEGIPIQVIDCYSIKPIDANTLKKAAAESKLILTVEDHYPVGGLGDAVLEALADTSHPPVIKLAVNKLPRSGKPEDLLEYAGISATSMLEKVRTNM